LLTSISAYAAELNSIDSVNDLRDVAWIHGAQSCKNDQNPLIQVIQGAPSSYILRQNKCVTFEAPFIYVLFGHNTVLVVDTGANKSESESPIFKTIESLIERENDGGLSKPTKILVLHSHSHSDHTKGDDQFLGKDQVEIVGTNQSDLERQLGLTGWPYKSNTIDLGGREVTIIPTPGHQDQSLAIYDSKTQWLLTGDTLYPGLIRVKDWSEYKASIERIIDFSNQNPVTLILGAHIETNQVTKKPYRIGKTYQPDEAPLPLSMSDVRALHDKLKLTEKRKQIRFESFVISPLSRFEKLILKVANRVRKQV